MAKNGGLGRGLDEVFGNSFAPRESGSVSMLPINRIEPNHEQPRKQFDGALLEELAESIRLHGVISPLTVRKIDENRYQIIAGERRYRAARLAGLTELPVVVRDADEITVMELALVENLQRSDLNPLEEADGFRKLIDRHGFRQEDVAERVGRSRSAVANALRLLELTPEVAQMVSEGTLSAGHARALLAVRDPAKQLAAAKQVTEHSLSVRQTELLVKRLNAPEKEEETPKPDYAGELAKQLAVSLGRGVKITADAKNRGKVILDYYSLDDLDAILQLLSGSKPE